MPGQAIGGPGSERSAALRTAAEIRVVISDMERLRSGEKLSPLRKKGLLDRISGGMSGLIVLVRQADALSGRVRVDRNQTIFGAVRAVEIRDYRSAWEYLKAIEKDFPLNPPKPVKAKNMARKLHERYCAGCHDDPELDVERPAYNLFTQAKLQSRAEFFARMLVGVRGDRTTGLSNPFTNRELSALVSYYRGGKP